RRIRLWDVETASEVPFLDERRESSPPMAFTPDDAFLILAQGMGIYGQPRRFDSAILAWDRKTGKIEKPFVEFHERTEAGAVSASAGLLGVASQWHLHSHVRLWSLTSKQEQGKFDLPRIPQAHLRAAVQELAFSPDGRTLAVAAGTQVFVFDVPGKRLRGT